jgi:hypothetical protein
MISPADREQISIFKSDLYITPKYSRTMTHDWDDPVKAKSRDRLRGFVKANLIAMGKPARDAVVLCLPGEKALEIFQVYRELGIPDQNIFGIEIDAQVYETLQFYMEYSKTDDSYDFPRFNLPKRPMRDLEFLATTDHRFDIISLDYCSNLHSGVLDALMLISGRRLLNDRGVLAVNVQAAREMKRYSSLLAEIAFAAEEIRKTGLASVFGPMPDTVPFNGEVRSSSLTQLYINTLELGIENLAHDPIYSRLPGYTEINSAIRQQYIEQARLSGQNLGRRQNMEELVARMDRGSFCGNTLYHLYHMENLTQMLMASGLPQILGKHIVLWQGRGYFPDRMERLSYVSRTATPMFMDMFRLRQLERLLSPTMKVHNRYTDPDRILRVETDDSLRIYIADTLAFDSADPGCAFRFRAQYNRNPERIERALKMVDDIYRSLWRIEYAEGKFPSREHLGTSAEPRSKGRLITQAKPLNDELKQEVRSLVVMALQDGPAQLAWLKEWLPTQYEISSGQIAAYIAHAKMGTYS